MKLPFFKKADIIIVVLIAAIGIGSIFAFAGSKEAGKSVVVSVDGEVVATYNLSENKTYEISNSYGLNKIVIEDGKVWIGEADCHGQDCVRLGKISSPGQLIVCLPHHLTVSIGGDSDGEPDIVLR